MPEADPRTARLERIDQRRNRTVVDLDLSTPQGRAPACRPATCCASRPIRDSLEGAVSLEGHVHRGGGVQFQAGMRLTDLIGSLDELRPLADTALRAHPARDGPTRGVGGLGRPGGRVRDPGSAAKCRCRRATGVCLRPRQQPRPRDRADPPPTSTARAGATSRCRPSAVGGRVKVPGQYPLEPGMRVSDLIRAGGSLDQAAYGGTAELARYEVIDGERRQTEVIPIDLKPRPRRRPPPTVAAAVRLPGHQGDAGVARPGVHGPGRRGRFPGRYPVRRGETLRSVIERAGGLTDLAFVEGSVFTRRDLKEREQKQLQVLAERLQRELASLSLQQSRQSEPDSTSAGHDGRARAACRPAGTEAVGRLVISSTG
jgi:polysaccharide biosynthesis/export protein